MLAVAMSQPKGTCFVLLLAILPPLFTLACHLQPDFVPFPRLSPLLLACTLPPYLFLLHQFIYPFFTHPLNRLPTPPGGSFVLGHGTALLDIPPGKSFSNWVDTIPNHGLIFFRTFFYTSPSLLLASPESLAEVLIAKSYDFDKAIPAKRFLKGILGNGLVLATGRSHKEQRKALTPAFRGSHINNLVPIFWDKARELLDVLATELRSKDNPIPGTVEIGGPASRATLDVISLACCGHDFRSLHNADDEMANVYNSLFNQKDRPAWAVYYLINAYIPLPILRRIPFRRYNRRARIGDQLRRVCHRLIAEKRADMDRGVQQGDDILSMLLRTDTFDEESLVDQMLTFFAAGHETTSNALTWASYFLAIHPHIQDRLRAELTTHVRLTDDAFTNDTLNNLPYLQAVSQEVLRFQPTVPLTGRTALRDTTILGQHIPKGTEVLLCPQAINRSPRFWGPDAAVFNPDRWLCAGSERGADDDDDNKPGAAAALHGGANSPYANLTFLHGPRSCIGERFARAELRCFLAALVLRYRMEVADEKRDVTPVGMVTVRPREGLLLRLVDV